MLTILVRNNLREILKNSRLTIQWRDEDVARTKFRLAIVLMLQNRSSECTQLIEEARDMREGSSSQPSVGFTTNPTERDEMKLFDIGVTICHGRTAGIWSPGEE